MSGVCCSCGIHLRECSRSTTWRRWRASKASAVRRLNTTRGSPPAPRESPIYTGSSARRPEPANGCPTMNPAPIKPTITADLLDKLDIRVGTILAVDDVPNSDKLVQLRVGFGDHERIIVSGMKQER